jgi:hypothetical protein
VTVDTECAHVRSLAASSPSRVMIMPPSCA